MLLSANLWAQQPTRRLTSAELQAKVAALEQELGNVQRDYQLLLTTCQAPAAIRTVADANAAAERLALAAKDLQNAQANAENRAEQLQHQQRVQDDLWRVKSVDYGITESNRIFIRFGWTVTISNGLDTTQAFDVTVQFLDKHGLVVDSQRKYGVVVGAFDEGTIRDSALVSMPGALNVASVHAVASRRR